MSPGADGARAAWWRSRLAASLLIALVALAACLLQLSLSKPIYPHDDELGYLAYGRSLAETGRYAATLAGPSADRGPGREPLYPALIAAVMRLDPVLHQAAGRCIGNTDDPGCVGVFEKPALDQCGPGGAGRGAGLSLCPLARRRTARGGERRALLALNLQMMKETKYVISDYLALALAAAVMLALAVALARPRSALRWIAVGVALALLVLTKALFEIYALAFLGALVVWLVVRRSRAAATAVVAVGLVLATLLGGWSARNWATFGRFALTDGRGGVALSTREVFDHMTAGEYAASFFWWTRGPGPGLARALFPPRDWHRHEWEPSDGFYEEGQVNRYEARVQRLMAERGLDRAAAETLVPGVIVAEIAQRLPMYLATMIPLAYRGLWFDEFVVFGFPAFVWLLIRSWRRRAWNRLVVLSPAAFSLLAYPALSLNIARYQIPAGPGLALAAGFALAGLVEWRRRRRAVPAAA